VSSVLSTAVLLVGALGLLNLFLSLAVIRYLRTERIGQAWRPTGSDLTPLGTVITWLSVTTVDGARVTDAELRLGRVFVGLLRVGCPSCGEFVDKVAAGALTLPAKSLILVVADSQDEAHPYLERLGNGIRVATTGQDSPELRAFGEVGAFPTFLRLDNGVVTIADYRPAVVLGKFSDAMPTGAR
jgi:hypothetical protein